MRARDGREKKHNSIHNVHNNSNNMCCISPGKQVVISGVVHWDEASIWGVVANAFDLCKCPTSGGKRGSVCMYVFSQKEETRYMIKEEKSKKETTCLYVLLNNNKSLNMKSESSCRTYIPSWGACSNTVFRGLSGAYKRRVKPDAQWAASATTHTICNKVMVFFLVKKWSKFETISSNRDCTLYVSYYDSTHLLTNQSLRLK